ncbi:molybdopterin molybdotransferase MoeA [Adlercreutzia faecimuris]|uniref:Molybdopterin molybdenumtransferase n=1 Tax=Adlercreutzia faecimuris TaxID=2897341 RepID=A0ABS9WET1_9ACTN|nr:gephyrin-like molybdotransferase Glp [Adlercreutzia sp. JBNU-10]MCI2241373.1 molybdopterin molybdotransferase MoeA [Adlercreutzia sp. JBNU-10]
MTDMISLEEARALVLAQVAPLDSEVVPLLEVVGRVAAADLASDIDIAPFAHSAMDGFALRAAEIAGATEDAPTQLKVIAEIGAGDVFSGAIAPGECVRIMTGAPLPDDADSVVKYEIVAVVEGDGKPGSTVAFAAPTAEGSNVRPAGEEARAGEVVVERGEVIGAAGVGFLASCGVLEVPAYRRPRVAIIATGSELVPPDQVPGPGQIRNSNSYAMAACAQEAGAVPVVLPIVADTFEALRDAVDAASRAYDFVVTTGGAANGDFDFIKPVVDELGDLLMTSVNMRPGKAQTFGLVNGTPVFGLPGNPAAAYCGFELIIRAALRKMQGFAHVDRPTVRARLTAPVRKKDVRRLFSRSTLTRAADGAFEVTPAKNQSSGLFGPIQKSNCLASIPEGPQMLEPGDEVECILLDVSEEVPL